MDEAVKYKSGDIVWVQVSKRLGWWPGRVENLMLLSPPLKAEITDTTVAVVKYFNEENYKFVEERDTICPYNSSAKDEYISFGMKKYFEKKRLNEASSTFMKFPNDVRQAEILSGGNPAIIESEKYQPVKQPSAQSKYKDIFVNPNLKDSKSPKRQEVKSPVKSTAAQRSRTVKKESPDVIRTPVRTDHEVRIRRQASPIRTTTSTSTSPVATAPYTCDLCAFTATRINVLICHRKTHSGAESPNPTVKSGQKRATPSSARKTGAAYNKRKKTSEGDLFDQVKGNLDSSASSTPKTQRRKATPKSARNTPAASTKETMRKSPAKTPSSSAGSVSKARQLCPKKKWLNLSQKEENPEVKIKLMADWDEEEDEEQPEAKTTADPANTAPAAEAPQNPPENRDKESDSEDDLPPKLGLLHQRSDDEEDEDGTEAEAADQDDALANISAEIDKLNAEMDQIKEEKPLVNGQQEKANGAAEATEQLKQEVASLLSETTVPVLPDMMSLKAVDSADVDAHKDQVNGTNILMQVEGSSETYMVMWEPGSNIQDLLYEGHEEGQHQTLILNSSALAPATELENIFQMAVDNAAAAAAAASQNEQSTPNGPSKCRPKAKSEQLLVEYGTAVDREIKSDDVVWARLKRQLYLPAGVVHCDAKFATVAVFDAGKPLNQHKLRRTQIIAAFSDDLNRELSGIGRSKKRVAEISRLENALEHAQQFRLLKQAKHPDLTVRQYLKCCNKSPVQVFSERYLSVIDKPEKEEEPLELDSDGGESDTDVESDEKLELLSRIIDRHVLTDACLEHLRLFVTLPSSVMELYDQQKWSALSVSGTVGIVQQSHQMYRKVADFLTANVGQIKALVKGRDHRRVLVLDVLLPEALRYGIQNECQVSAQEAAEIVIYGFKKVMPQKPKG